MTCGMTTPTAVYIELFNQYLDFNRYWMNQYIAYMNLWIPKNYE
jgi:hypothetical protein